MPGGSRCRVDLCLWRSGKYTGPHRQDRAGKTVKSETDSRYTEATQGLPKQTDTAKVEIPQPTGHAVKGPEDEAVVGQPALLPPEDESDDAGKPLTEPEAGKIAPGQADEIPKKTSDRSTTNDVEEQTSVVFIGRQQNGDPVLRINYDWKKLARPSVQVALVIDENVDPSSLSPIELDGASTAELWQKQVSSVNKPIHPAARQLVKNATAFIEYGNRELLTLRARENSLGKPAGYAVDEKDGTVAVFYLLDGWTDESGVFRVELSDLDLTSKFADPGRVCVWVLSEEKVVKSETASWPGKQAPESVVQEQPAEQPEEKPASKTEKPAAAEKVVQEQPPELPWEEPPSKTEKPAATQGVSSRRPVEQPGKEPVPDSPPQTVESTESKRPVETDVNKMGVDQLARHIERTWGGSMSADVRKAWAAGWFNYYEKKNPDRVRRAVFLSLLRTCYKKQASGPLRDAFATLYVKLRKEAEAAKPE